MNNGLQQITNQNDCITSLSHVGDTGNHDNFVFIPSDDYSRPLKIMPLGDSITTGIISKQNRNSGGYRTELWSKLVTTGLRVEFVGSQSRGPESLGDKAHEGHPGWSIQRIAQSVSKWLDTYQPDLVLLMIGTIDTKNKPITAILKEFINLIDRIIAHSPNLQLLIASIPPIHSAKQPTKRALRATYFNAAIPVIVKFKAAQGKKVYFVDMRSLKVSDLTSSVSLDLDSGLHPNAQGYCKIANFWYSAILKIVSKQQNYSASNLRWLPTQSFLPWRLFRRYNSTSA